MLGERAVLDLEQVIEDLDRLHRVFVSLGHQQEGREVEVHEVDLVPA